MRYELFGRRALPLLAVVLVLAACSTPNSAGVAQYAVPTSVQGAQNVQAHTLGRPTSTEAALYISTPQDYSGSVVEAIKPGKKKFVVECTITETGPAPYPEGLTTDAAGNLYVVNNYTNTVATYAPGCQYTGTISDPYGDPIAVALKGSTVYIASHYGPSQESEAGIAVCSVSSGCNSELTNSDMTEIRDIAFDKHGNLYVDAEGNDTGYELLEFPGGQMPGVVLITTSPMDAGIQFDKNGNLIGADNESTPTSLTVFSGCPSACQEHGPFPLEGPVLYLTLNKSNSTLFATDPNYKSDYLETIDEYYYSGTAGVTYKRSIAVPSNLGVAVGIAIFPRSKD